MISIGINAGRSNSRGFTMVELMFVMAILGVLLALTIPKLTGTNQKTALETTGRNMARLAAYARQSAISLQAESTMAFDRKERIWYLQLPIDEEDERTKRILIRRRRESRDKEHIALSEEEEPNLLAAKLEFTEFLIDGDTHGENKLEITFYPNGRCSGGTVILKNGRGKSLTVDFEASTGAASAYRGEPKDFLTRLQEEGIDTTPFGGESPVGAAGTNGASGKGFYKVGDDSERASYYADAAARIMGRTRRNHERELQDKGSPDAGRKTSTADKNRMPRGSRDGEKGP